MAPYSYTLYITHVPIMLFVFGITQPWIHNSLLASIIISVTTITGITLFSKKIARFLENKLFIQSIFQLSPLLRRGFLNPPILKNPKNEPYIIFYR